MKDVFLELEVLTPVHIGTNETLDPISYIMRKENGRSVFYTVDTLAWIEDQVHPEELAALFAGSNVPAIRNHLATKINPEIYAGRSAEMAAPLAFSEYIEKLADQRSLHSLRLSPGLTSPVHQTLLVPGSSIKGAIRTAITDLLDQQERLGLKALRAKDKKGKEVAKKLEEYFGTISSSAFKQLKIGDFEGYLDTSIIVDAVEKSHNADKKATPKDPCEVFPNRIMRPSGQWKLHGRGWIGSHAIKDDHVLRLNKGNFRWTWNELAKIVNDFYQLRYSQEKAKFYGLQQFSDTKRALAEQEEAVLNPAPGEMVLRVGHYSHVECITITNNNPQTRRVNDKELPYGTTRTLAGGIYPFGWIKLRPCDQETYVRGVTDRQEHNQAIMTARKRKRAAAIEAKATLILERQLQAQEKDKQRENEKQLQIQWKTMSEEARDLAIIRREEQALLFAQNLDPLKDVWPKLDAAAPEHQKAMAMAYKETWENDPKMWRKKICSQKQWAKVQRVKEILGYD